MSSVNLKQRAAKEFQVATDPRGTDSRIVGAKRSNKARTLEPDDVRREIKDTDADAEQAIRGLSRFRSS